MSTDVHVLNCQDERGIASGGSDQCDVIVTVNTAPSFVIDVDDASEIKYVSEHLSL